MEMVSLCFLKCVSIGARHFTWISLFDKYLLKDDYDPVYLLILQNLKGITLIELIF